MKEVTKEEREKVAEILDIPIDFVDHLIEFRDDLEWDVEWSDVVLYIP